MDRVQLETEIQLVRASIARLETKINQKKLEIHAKNEEISNCRSEAALAMTVEEWYNSNIYQHLSRQLDVLNGQLLEDKKCLNYLHEKENILLRQRAVTVTAPLPSTAPAAGTSVRQQGSEKEEEHEGTNNSSGSINLHRQTSVSSVRNDPQQQHQQQQQPHGNVMVSLPEESADLSGSTTSSLTAAASETTTSSDDTMS